MRAGLSTHFRWCAAGCGWGQEHPEGDSSPLIICNQCRKLTCFTHQAPWHDGMTCYEFDNPDEGQKSVLSKRQKGFGALFRQTVVVGGVTRKETKQERKDRKYAQKLEKQEKEHIVAVQAQEEETRRQQQAQEEQARQRRELEVGRNRRRQEEAASTAAVNTISKTCSKCKAPIEKNGGCDHMSCRLPLSSPLLSAVRCVGSRIDADCFVGSRCGYQFCWICSADWKPIRKHGNEHHQPDCKYHSSKL